MAFFFFVDGQAGVSKLCRFFVVFGVEFFAAFRARKAEVPSNVKVVSRFTASSIFPHLPQKRAPHCVQKTVAAAGKMASSTTSRGCPLHIDRIQMKMTDSSAEARTAEAAFRQVPKVGEAGPKAGPKQKIRRLFARRCLAILFR